MYRCPKCNLLGHGELEPHDPNDLFKIQRYFCSEYRTYSVTIPCYFCNMLVFGINAPTHLEEGSCHLCDKIFNANGFCHYLSFSNDHLNVFIFHTNGNNLYHFDIVNEILTYNCQNQYQYFDPKDIKSTCENLSVLTLFN